MRSAICSSLIPPERDLLLDMMADDLKLNLRRVREQRERERECIYVCIPENDEEGGKCEGRGDEGSCI